jgi:hypothetical protein
MTAVWLCISALSAMGQSAQSLQIPFEFYVGDSKLPAGSYQIAIVGSAVRITNIAMRDKAVAFNPIPITRPDGSPRTGGLVFYTYGRNHFLSEIWVMGSESGLSVPKPEFQAELARKKQSIRIESQAIAHQ